MDQPSTLHISANTGHFVSNDAGANWQLSRDHRGLYVRDPNDRRTYFWAGSDFWPQTSVFSVWGIYRSKDDAQSWEEVGPRPPDPIGEFQAFAAPPPGPGVPSAVFASIAGGYRLPEFHFWRTLNGGDTWQRVSLLADQSITAFTFDSQRGTSYAASSKSTGRSPLPRLWKSTDYFQSSRAELRLPGEVEQVREMYLFQGLLLLVGVNPPPYPRGKIWLTDNEGVSWFPLTQVLHLKFPAKAESLSL